MHLPRRQFSLLVVLLFAMATGFATVSGTQAGPEVRAHTDSEFRWLFASGSATGGKTVSIRVTIWGSAPAGGARVALTSSNAAIVVPNSITIPAGESERLIRVSTNAVTANTPVTLTATYRDRTRTKTIQILRPYLSSTTVQSQVTSGQSGKVVVRLSGVAPAGGVVVDLESTDLAALSVPAKVTIAAGQASTTVYAPAGQVAADTPVTVGAIQGSVRIDKSTIVRSLPNPTSTATPTQEASATATEVPPTETETSTAIPATATGTATTTETETATTAPPTATETASETATATETETSTAVPPTATETATATETETQTQVPPAATETPTETHTATETATDTATATATETWTAVPPTATETATSTETETSTPVPPAATDVPTGTHTPIATETETSTAVPPTATASPTETATLPPVVVTETETATATATNTATPALGITIQRIDGSTTMPVGSSVSFLVCLTGSPSQHETLLFGTTDSTVTWILSTWSKTIAPGSTGPDLCETVVMTNSMPGTAALSVSIQNSAAPPVVSEAINWTAPPASATPSSTPVPPTATNTATPVPPTPTNTPVPPTATATITAAPVSITLVQGSPTMPTGSSVSFVVCLTYSPTQFENLNFGTSNSQVSWTLSTWNKSIPAGASGPDLCETVVMTNSLPGVAALTVTLQGSGLPAFLSQNITWGP